MPLFSPVKNAAEQYDVQQMVKRGKNIGKKKSDKSPRCLVGDTPGLAKRPANGGFWAVYFKIVVPIFGVQKGVIV